MSTPSQMPESATPPCSPRSTRSYSSTCATSRTADTGQCQARQPLPTRVAVPRLLLREQREVPSSPSSPSPPARQPAESLLPLRSNVQTARKLAPKTPKTPKIARSRRGGGNGRDFDFDADASSPADLASQVGPSRSVRYSMDSPWSTTPSKSKSVPHPYARLYAYQEQHSDYRPRRQWSHALETSIFSHEDMLRLRAAHRRPIYISSLEAHVDRLHAQLIDHGLYPIPFADLAPFKGMSSKIVKGMIAGLQTDAQLVRSKQCEIERANLNLRNCLNLAMPRYNEAAPDFRARSPRSATLLPTPSFKPQA